ncbi:hypothetical protein AV926_06770 [Myroides marinus]|uniref:Uncharacterized protein n=1 Tax=Myroides marinus TaxID=703342 RepID=A0A164A0X0_9FLAO|nr:hypothetical protein [Myroides marinus]KUF44404.1 hypothetical protein AS361_03195 [Myroides marinus]KZE82803.1 hypothetical protein AV926_06770 [Myroides marinus]
MDEIKSNLIEIKEYTMDRLKMPIFFYYFVLLAVWNWDIILLVLKSNASIEDIIIKIKAEESTWVRYVIPFIVASLGNVIFPLVMYGIDYPLSWINIGRNKKASEVELKKAKSEHLIQQERTGGATLDALNTQIKVLNQDKNNLTKALEEASKRSTETEKTLQDNDKVISSYKDEISELEQKLIHFNHPTGHGNIEEEINSFREVLDFFIENGGDKEDVHKILRKLSDEGNSTPLMVIQNWKNYEDFLQKGIIINSFINGISYVELLPYGIKFMYWLEGVLSNSIVENEKDLDKEITNLIEEQSTNEKIYKKLIELGLINSFEKDMIRVKEDKAIPENTMNYREYLKYNLIKVKRSGLSGSRFYELTPRGESLFNYIVQKEL